MKNEFKSTPKPSRRIFIFYSITTILSLILFIISIVSFYLIKSLKLLEENNPDIDLLGMIDFKFSSSIDNLEYTPGKSNLGTTGKLFLDCYNGIFEYIRYYECIQQQCEGIGEDQKCYQYKTTCESHISILNYLCSKDCRKTGSNSCHYSYCTYYSNVQSNGNECLRKKDDVYSEEKSCYADNLILKWKDLYYNRINVSSYGEFSYLKNAVKKNESCPENSKLCGILDNLGNKLCYPLNVDCPINFITLNISEMKYYNYSYNYSIIDNKTIYYTNENVNTGKIVGGLFVDSDLLIKYKDDECQILDTGNISQLLEYNPYKLYKNSLNFDPYKDENINEKGKSYLKWCIPGNGRIQNLDTIREVKIQYDSNVTNNKDIINSLMYGSSPFYISFPGFVTLLIFFISIINLYPYKR